MTEPSIYDMESLSNSDENEYHVESDSYSDSSIEGEDEDIVQANTDIVRANTDIIVSPLKFSGEHLPPLDDEEISEKQSVKAILAKEGTFYSKYLQGSDFIELQVLNHYQKRETRMEFSKILYGVIDLISFEKVSVMIL
jgi:hypothetical protein